MQTIEHTHMPLIYVALNAIVITFALLIAYRIVIVIYTVKAAKHKKNVWCVLLYCTCAFLTSTVILSNDYIESISTFTRMCYFVQTYAALYLCYKSLQKTLAVLAPTSKLGKISKSKITNYESKN